MNLDAARETFDLNFFSALHVTQAFAPSLIAAKGKVINIGSIGGKIVTPFTGMRVFLIEETSLRIQPWRYILTMEGIYAASKAALHLMSETLRVEMAPFDVKVITVCIETGARIEDRNI